MKLADILKDSNYKLSQFTEAEIIQLEKTIALKTVKSGEVPYTICLVRQKEIKLTPEEVIRQLYLRVLTERLGYPLSRIQVEYGVNFGREVKRADIVVMDKKRPNTVYILIEVKKPKLKDGREQLHSYCHGTGSPIAVWTNGDQISYYQRKDPNYFEDITDIPNANQSLADILNECVTLEDLIKKDKLVKENKSLKTLIEEMEDEVLANAGVDVFEELFKLIFTKLYDEWYSGQGTRRTTRCLEFRNTGQTEGELKTKIQNLFDKAKNKWEGIFSEDTKISLAPSHFSICVASLQNVKLFNSNMEVIDEAFEYLINKTSKDDKGQYFTPRYVIDMCVKILNPQEHESMIDTAAGSSGFPVHAIFHVWRQILKEEGLKVSHLFSLKNKPPRCKEYVEDKVFAIDFDEKAVRVARTLNLIAGDGQTNVLQLNTLDYDMWDEITQQEDWQSVYFTGFNRLKKLRPKGNKDYRDFQFDVLMANPPFAGEINETRIIYHYELGKKPNGKWQSKVGRDILFIERNLDFLKPGGRMAVVLPQGRFNNSSDKYIRDFIADRCRILAVVGLHGNTFKPHTGTKTSVLFLQKWNDDPKVGPLCPRKEDYNIFFATMQKSGKDNSGDKIYVKRSDGSGDFLLDEHGHRIVDHDLFNHDGLTQDGIAEAFMEFAKKEALSFFDLGSSVTPFDAVKYERLMGELEMAELSLYEIKINNLSFRIDAEFFQKKYLSIINILTKTTTLYLSEVTNKIDVGHVGSMVSEYRETGVFLLQTRNVDEFFVNIQDCQRITDNFHQQLQKSQIKKNDILIARSGSFGKACIYLDSEIINSSDIIIVESANNKINRFYLVTFLNSKFGKQQLFRFASGGLQGHVNLTILENLLVKILTDNFQSSIEIIIKQSYELLQQSKIIYEGVEDLLLSELSLKDWQPTEETVAVKSFAESFLSSGRLDAEYYQPKYDEIENQIKSYSGGWDYLGNKFLVETGEYSSEYFERSQNLKFYIRNTNIISGQIKIDENYYVFPHKFSKFTQVGDILTARVGAIGSFGTVNQELESSIYSDNVLSLRQITQDEILPDVYALYFNTKANKELMDKLSGGSVQPLITQTSIKLLPIPIFDIKLQQKINIKINESFELKDKSKQLLEIAKTAVEKAIETDEATATDWINQQLQILNIDIQKLE
jgi:type I restriction enzyme M protein